MTSTGRTGWRAAWLRHRVSALTLTCILLYAVFIEMTLGWASVLAAWRTIGLPATGLALLLLVSTYFVRAWRLSDYFPQETAGRYVEIFRLAQVHNVLNIVLPFRSGETSFPILMRSQFAVPLIRGTSALMVMRLLDLHALLAAAGAGLALGAGSVLHWSLWLLFLLAPLLAFQVKDPLVALGKARLPARFGRFLSDVEAGLPVDNRALLRAWAMTVLNWGVKVAVLAWIIGLMGVGPLSACFGGALGGELSSVLPVHAPAGVGTYPAGIVAGAVAFGASADGGAVGVLARASVNLHLLMLVSALAGLAVSLLLSGLAGRRR